MLLFDSHCHLDDKIFEKDLDAVLARASSNGVLGMTVVGIDEATSYRAIDLASKYDELYASIGFHPHNANKCNFDALSRLIDKLKHSKAVVAWGEIGLDFNRMYSDRNQQESCFIKQIQIADDLKMPIIIHERDTGGKLIKILNAHRNPLRIAVVHCFSGNYHEMERYLEMGFYIGVTGILTILRRGENLRNLVKNIPSNRLLIETDSPYLIPAPQKNKKKRNEPSFIKTILLRLAETREEDGFILANQIWKNTCNFFNINSEVLMLKRKKYSARTTLQ